MPNLWKLFQVVNIDSQTGSYDIASRLLDPAGTVLSSVADPTSFGSHASGATADGDHILCFDNTHAAFAAKTVSFSLTVEDAPSSLAEYVYDYGDYIEEGELEEMRKQDVQVILIRLAFATHSEYHY